MFRYDPEVAGKQEPRFDDFHVPYHKGMTVLDALMYARDHYDSSLTFRHSCRQAICGSDALFVNGRSDSVARRNVGPRGPVRIEPLPHQEVVKDLVVDMEHFYDQMESVEPYFQTTICRTANSKSSGRRVKTARRSRCPRGASGAVPACPRATSPRAITSTSARRPSTRRTASRWTNARARTASRTGWILEQEHGVWRCQTQFSCTEVCPKDIPLTEHIQELKREAVKNNLKFW